MQILRFLMLLTTLLGSICAVVGAITYEQSVKMETGYRRLGTTKLTQDALVDHTGLTRDQVQRFFA